jgi:7-cyano-7-deazaguanine synthase in queuosine biosynthesis
MGSSMKTAILFSGGLDSVYCAWKILTSSQDELTLVFLNCDDVSSNMVQNYSHIFSATALKTPAILKSKVQSIHNWLNANVRSCTLDIVDLTENMLSRQKINSHTTCLLPMLFDKINSGQLDKIVSSHELENDGFAINRAENFQSTRKIDSKRMANLFALNAQRGKLEFLLIDSNYTQATALIELDKDLLDLTVSCESIYQTGVSCGTCFKCEKRKLFCEKIDSGASSSDIYQWYVKQCTVDDKWWSMKNWIGLFPQVSKKEIKRDLFVKPDWPFTIDKGV